MTKKFGKRYLSCFDNIALTFPLDIAKNAILLKYWISLCVGCDLQTLLKDNAKLSTLQFQRSLLCYRNICLWYFHIAPSQCTILIYVGHVFSLHIFSVNIIFRPQCRLRSIHKTRWTLLWIQLTLVRLNFAVSILIIFTHDIMSLCPEAGLSGDRIQVGARFF